MSWIQIKKITPAIVEFTLNDPDRLNAMGWEMGAAISSAAADIKNDPNIRVVLIRGAGRAFSSGGNIDFIKENSVRDSKENETLMVKFYKQFLSIAEIPVPTVAMIHGPAVGAGLAIALACDVRFSTDSAKMGVNFTKIGLTPGMGSTFFLPRVVGKAHALDLFATGRLIGGVEAKAIGLVHQSYATEDELFSAGLAWAETVSKNAPLALRGTKRLLSRDLSGLDEALYLEAKEQAIVFASKDLREGIASIEQKRPAIFRGE